MIYTLTNGNKVFIDFHVVKTIKHRHANYNTNEIEVTWLTNHNKHFYILDDASIEKIFEDIELFKKNNI